HPRPVARTHPYAYTQSTCRQRPTQNYENTMPQPVHVPSQQCPSAIPYSNEWYGIQMQRSQEQTYYYPI
uniref:Uncharacterized protein n=1 Tax=Caenorhabditis japonica TaxID=281687 RepID=A0A8R1IE68_CAEJA